MLQISVTEVAVLVRADRQRLIAVTRQECSVRHLESVHLGPVLATYCNVATGFT